MEERGSMLIAHDRSELASNGKLRSKFDWKRAFGVGVLRDRARSLHRERWLIRRLRKSVIRRGAMSVERISGGLSNHNFAVHTEGHACFARICQERRLLGIDRRNEVVCHQIASARGLAPEVVHHEKGLLVTRYIEGQTLGAVDVRTPAVMSKLAALLCHLHEAWDVLTGEVLYFCPFQTVRTYAETAVRLGAILPADIGRLLEDARELARQIAPFRPVLCHNDLMPGNLIDDGSRLWLVDWEYAGAGHPLFDLANASANAGFGDDEDRALLEAYPGHFSLRNLVEFQVFKAASLLRESLWSTIQTVASDIDFDYRGYASKNLLAYRAARDRLPQIGATS
jgi:thiamine kinase-like enzyme